MPKVKKQKQKQKQHQAQVQNVVVNVGYKRRKQRQKEQHQSTTVSKQQLPQQQAIPYLGLQSANNAQLLNTLQASIAALYKNNKELSSVPATNGFQTASLLPPQPQPQSQLAPPPSAPQLAPPQLAPPPPPQRASPRPPNYPPPQFNNQNQQSSMKQPPQPSQRTPQAYAVSETSQQSAPSSTTSSKRGVSFQLPPGGALPPPGVLRSLVEKNLGQSLPEPPTPTPSLAPSLKGSSKSKGEPVYNKNGTIDKRSKWFKNLPPDERQQLILEETINKPARGKLVKDDGYDTDVEVTLPEKMKKEPAARNLANDMTVAAEAIPPSILPHQANITEALNTHRTHSHIEIKPQTPVKNILSYFIKQSNNKVAIADADTESGDATQQIDTSIDVS